MSIDDCYRLAITRDGTLLPEVHDFRYVELFSEIYFIADKFKNSSEIH